MRIVTVFPFLIRECVCVIHLLLQAADQFSLDAALNAIRDLLTPGILRAARFWNDTGEEQEDNGTDDEDADADDYSWNTEEDETEAVVEERERRRGPDDDDDAAGGDEASSQGAAGAPDAH
ncbi:unnamed protein product [Gongylonema pulchrum]|uniref:Armadillo-type fold n=1 Tax=Gongylonema pulchrum TaxID=637853 RepID=A0A183DCQ0_9BILA|nr:unnamed protein product [Gongylonema pulchrum]